MTNGIGSESSTIPRNSPSISNAGKFTEEGKVELEARRERHRGADVLVFRVADTGIG